MQIMDKYLNDGFSKSLKIINIRIMLNMFNISFVLYSFMYFRVSVFFISGMMHLLSTMHVSKSNNIAVGIPTSRKADDVLSEI